MTDVTITARYDLPAGATASDLAELLLTVPADARIGFMVPVRPVQSYSDVAPPEPARTMTATWTVPAGQPLTPPNVAPCYQSGVLGGWVDDDAPAAGWADPTDVSSCAALDGHAPCRCTIAGVTVELQAEAEPTGPLPPACPSCGRSGDDPCVGSLTGSPIPSKHMSRVHVEADEQHAVSTVARARLLGPAAGLAAGGITGYDLSGPEANFAAHEARREAIRTETRRRLDDPIALGGTGL